MAYFYHGSIHRRVEPDEIIISVPENNLGVFHHAYQENFYNGEKMFENLLQR